MIRPIAIARRGFGRALYSAWQRPTVGCGGVMLEQAAKEVANSYTPSVRFMDTG